MILRFARGLISQGANTSLKTIKERYGVPVSQTRLGIATMYKKTNISNYLISVGTKIEDYSNQRKYIYILSCLNNQNNRT